MDFIYIILFGNNIESIDSKKTKNDHRLMKYLLIHTLFIIIIWRYDEKLLGDNCCLYHLPLCTVKKALKQTSYQRELRLGYLNMTHSMQCGLYSFSSLYSKNLPRTFIYTFGKRERIDLTWAHKEL